MIRKGFKMKLYPGMEKEYENFPHHGSFTPFAFVAIAIPSVV